MKRYNLLVPDIFPKKEPEVSERVDASTERKYKKLNEYIAKNPHRGPKVPLILIKFSAVTRDSSVYTRQHDTGALQWQLGLYSLAQSCSMKRISCDCLKQQRQM